MKREKVKEIVINSGLVICSIVFLYLILELVAFRFFMQWLPLRTYAFLDPGIRIFAQSSKRGTIPHDYALILGDSYALGLGDWFLDANKNINPDFNSAHVIHNNSGMDVINFGYAGADSLRGLVAFPKPYFDYSKKTILYDLEQPKYIIVYFYEGNDLDDNVREIDVRFKGRYDFSQIYDTEYFRKFLEEEVVVHYSLHESVKNFRFKDNFFVYKYIKALLENFRDIRKIETTKWPLGGYGPWMTEPYENGSPPYNKQMGIVPDGDQNKVIINDEEIKIPDGLQGPGLELSDEQIDLAVYVFGQSLHYLREQFPETKIGVVYIPSPLSSYQISSEVVSISPYDHRVSELIYDAPFLHERSNSVFSKIKGAVDEQNIKLIDLRPLVLEYTKKKVIHGPQEWFHFNKEGHALLGRAVINLIHDLNAGR